MILVTGMALDAVKTSLNHFHIDGAALSPLLSHSCLVPVPHWCAQLPPQVWQDQVVSHLKACNTKHGPASLMAAKPAPFRLCGEPPAVARQAHWFASPTSAKIRRSIWERPSRRVQAPSSLRGNRPGDRAVTERYAQSGKEPVLMMFLRPGRLRVSVLQSSSRTASFALSSSVFPFNLGVRQAAAQQQQQPPKPPNPFETVPLGPTEPPKPVQPPQPPLRPLPRKHPASPGRASLRTISSKPSNFAALAASARILCKP